MVQRPLARGRRVRRFRPLLAVVTSFTVAHSITLIASALGIAPGALWFPPLIETLIALSIVYMALENIVGARLERRWLIAFGFGLVHGFGFSFALRESLQFAGSHLLTALLSFNLGVELGQLLVIALAMPAFAALYRWVVNERMGGILISALIAHSAWHWMTARAADLRQVVRKPVRDPLPDVCQVHRLLRSSLRVVSGTRIATGLTRFHWQGICTGREGLPPASNSFSN